MAIFLIVITYEFVSIIREQKFEKRIAITPEIAKKYINLGF